MKRLIFLRRRKQPQHSRSGFCLISTSVLFFPSAEYLPRASRSASPNCLYRPSIFGKSRASVLVPNTPIPDTRYHGGHTTVQQYNTGNTAISQSPIGLPGVLYRVYCWLYRMRPTPTKRDWAKWLKFEENQCCAHPVVEEGVGTMGEAVRPAGAQLRLVLSLSQCLSHMYVSILSRTRHA